MTTTRTTERIERYHGIIAEAHRQQSKRYRGAEYAAAIGLIRAALASPVAGDADKLARIAEALTALDLLRLRQGVTG